MTRWTAHPSKSRGIVCLRNAPVSAAGRERSFTSQAQNAKPNDLVLMQFELEVFLISTVALAR